MEDVIKEVEINVCELYNKRASLLTQLREIDYLLTKVWAKPNGNIMADYIINGIYDFYGITEKEFKRHIRNKEVIKRKRIAIYLLKNYTKLTLEKIGKNVGLKHHATIIHHIREAENLLSKELWGDPEFKHEYQQLLNHLKLNGNDTQTKNQVRD